MTFALARSLLLADAVKPEALAQALLVAATRGTSLVRALLAARAIEPARLEQHLDRGDAPYMRHVAPVLSLVQQLPAELCERLLAVPVRRDPRTGTVDVAVVDARDPHPVEEIAHWLKAPVRMVRTSLVSMEAALRHLHAKPDDALRPLAAPIWVPSGRSEPPRAPSETPSYGSPVYDPEGADGREAAGTTDPRAVDALVGHAPNIPIPLTRKSIVPVAIVDIGPPAIERGGGGGRTAEEDSQLSTLRGPPVRVIDGVAGTIGVARTAANATQSVAPFGPIAPSVSSRPEPATDPVLDLRKRKLTPPDPNVPPAPITSRGPFPLGAAEAHLGDDAPLPPFAELGPTVDAIRAASDRDTILALLLSGVRAVARRVAVFAVKRDELRGWTCSPEMGDRAALRVARMTVPPDSGLAAALATDSAMLVRVPKDATHAPVLAAMHAPPAGEVALISVRVEGKAVALVWADELGNAALATKRMQDVARAAGEALARVLREKRK